MSYPLHVKRIPRRPNFYIRPWSVNVSPFGADSATRKGIVSASKVSDLVGVGYNSRAQCLSLLTGIVEELPANDFLRSAQKHGQIYEQEAANTFMEKHGRAAGFRAMGSVEDQFTYRVGFADFEIAATPDLLLWHAPLKQSFILEIKCPYLAFQKGVDEIDASFVKFNYYVQMQFQMLCTGIQESLLLIYIPPDKMGLWQVKRDPEFQDFLLALCDCAYADMPSLDPKRWAMFKNEKALYTTHVVKSLRSHVNKII